MSKHKSDGKKKKKGSQLVIRLAKEERDAFVTLCDQRDTSAAREIRRFMREWVTAHTANVPNAEKPVDNQAAVEAPADEAEAAAPIVEAAAPVEGTDQATETLAEKPKAKRKLAAKRT